MQTRSNRLPRVSLVTPAYNHAEFLAETIESVLAQDYADVEYIVIDDGSTDDTATVLAHYADRVCCLRQDNTGQARALNWGWSLATGRYLGYLSSDDILHPSAVGSMVRALEADSGVVCAFPDSDLIDVTSKVVKRAVCRPFDLESLIVRQECFIGPGALFRREALEAAGGWRPSLRLAPDREFWIRLADHGRFHFEPRSLAGYRLHPRSISYNDVSEEASREYMHVLDGYFAKPGVPDAIARRKQEAYAYAKLVMARNAFRAGKFARGWALYGEACNLHGSLAHTSIKLTLLRNVLSKPMRMLTSKLRGGR